MAMADTTRSGTTDLPPTMYTCTVTAAHDYEDMHHLVDRLPSPQVGRLRVLVESDPELARFIQPADEEPSDAGMPQATEETKPSRHLSIIGILESGQGDLSERYDEIIRGKLNRST
jgi:hypothetical protein